MFLLHDLLGKLQGKSAQIFTLSTGVIAGRTTGFALLESNSVSRDTYGGIGGAFFCVLGKRRAPKWVCAVIEVEICKGSVARCTVHTIKCWKCVIQSTGSIVREVLGLCVR